LAGDTYSLQLAIRMCMRSEFVFLSTVILGHNSLGQSIDVCLQSLIDELNQMWSFKILTSDVSGK
jgi:hypothetical protein